MKSRPVIVALMLGSAWLARAGALENVAPKRGSTAAPITWTDENGRVRKLSDLAGHPLILLPIYTRCQSACIENVGQLKKALDDSRTDPKEFRVLLFSFDANDGPKALAEYRQRESVPLSWLIGTADQSNIDRLLGSIGFQVGKAGTEFMHPNMLVFLDAKLQIAKWIYGTDYAARSVDGALRITGGQSDWIGQHADYLYALLLFTAALLLVALIHQILRWRAMRERDVTAAARV